ncbi:MAG: RNA polymerase sigma factor SigJ [Acidimicrobiales bacterium]|nr:RNA polymerase sigma factor SigJ [Acidimicrobiales bacterium]MCB9392726.1 RNA polymerase sigma factor SigJ [Acidimicrobiaceae bacterium]
MSHTVDPNAVGADDTATFEAERARLTGIAYRLLGSVGDAEDVVQEAWLRWARADRTAIEHPPAWLTTVVGRLGLDRLRARRRDRTDYVGPWLPEPIVEPVADPAAVAELADSLTTAFLVLLETLAPDERLVVLLADVFAEPFPAIADVLGRTPDATRQLAVRARRKLATAREGRSDTPRPSAAEQWSVANRFVAAVMTGDLDEVRRLLDPAVVLVGDGGPARHAARRPVLGPERVARFVINIARRVPQGAEVAAVWVNGAPGLLVTVRGRPDMVLALDVRDARVQRVFSILNRDKLAAVGRSIALR